MCARWLVIAFAIFGLAAVGIRAQDCTFTTAQSTILGGFLSAKGWGRCCCC
jgi:hypothetical protein